MKVFRIFLVLGGKATPGDASNMWVRNLYDPLISAGHDVYLLDIDAYAAENGLGYMSKEAKQRLSDDLPVIFRQEHEKKPFDIFFSYLQNMQIIPEVLKVIKKSVYTINYSTNFHQFDIYKEIAGIVDYNIYISKIARSSFDNIGAKSYWMPLAANPVFYKPSTNKNNAAVFVGSVYGPRPYFFWRLLQYGIDLNLYGFGWKQKPFLKNTSLKSEIGKILRNITGQLPGKSHKSDQLDVTLRNQYDSINETILNLIRRDYPDSLHDSLSDTDYVKVLAEADTVINIQESRFNLDYFNHQVLYASNLRDFEATMCGTFLCTQYSEEIEELFDIGKEIICYYNEHDLSEKIQYFNKNTYLKKEIAHAGYQRSLKEHTWERRLGDFFNHIDF